MRQKKNKESHIIAVLSYAIKEKKHKEERRMIRIEYDRKKAVDYAKKWALRRNPKYFNYTGIGGDCTNFISQCVYAGCPIMNYTPTFGWYYIDPNDKSPSWTGVQYFYNFMTTNDDVGPFGEEASLRQLKVGDVIQLGKADGTFYHTLILTRIRSNFYGRKYYVCAHSDDAYNRDLATYSYENIRGIHILGGRKEF